MMNRNGVVKEGSYCSTAMSLWIFCLIHVIVTGTWLFQWSDKFERAAIKKKNQPIYGEIVKFMDNFDGPQSNYLAKIKGCHVCLRVSSPCSSLSFASFLSNSYVVYIGVSSPQRCLQCAGNVLAMCWQCAGNVLARATSWQQQASTRRRVTSLLLTNVGLHRK